MAEFVELKTEEWIPEIEQMNRYRLFDPKEIKSIVKKRREFEHKIQRRVKSKEDFLKYIQFEADLHKIIKARRQRMGYSASKVNVEYTQANRLGQLFKDTVLRFPDDLKLWFSYFKFCQEVNFLKSASKMLVRMMQVHSDKPNVWIFAANWEFEQGESVETSRDILLRAIRFHPESKIIHTEFFKLELEFMQIKKREKEEKIKRKEWITDEKADQIIEGKLAEVVYESAVKQIEDAEFKINLLALCKTYPDTTNIQKKIYQDLNRLHSEDELAWDAMAKRELEGIGTEESQKEGDGEPMETDSDKDRDRKTAKGRIQRSVDAYEKAVKKLKTAKMWRLYLDHLIELNNNSSSLPNFKKKLLKTAMEGALAAGHLSEKYYLHWIDVLKVAKGKKKKLAKVLKKGTEQHPQSLKLWHTRLRFHLTRNQEATGTAVFNEALKKLPNALKLWKLMIQYYQTKSTAKVEQLFKDGLKRGGEIAQSLKPLYVEWLVLTKGIGFARTIFESPELQHPPCLELLIKMAALESIQPDTNMKAIRRCHELACNHFGKTNTDVWIAYVKFETKFGEPIKVSQICSRAKNTLEPRLADVFSSEYNFFKTDMAL